MVSRSNHRRCSVKKGVLKNFTKFTQKHLLIKNKTPTQVLSCGFCETFKNTCSTEPHHAYASGYLPIFYGKLWHIFNITRFGIRKNALTEFVIGLINLKWFYFLNKSYMKLSTLMMPWSHNDDTINDDVWTSLRIQRPQGL